MAADASASRAAAEQAARLSYGRLVAFLAREWRDVAAAEDALSAAFAKALETWPVSGVPDRPEAWLMTVARRNLIHHGRHAAIQARSTAVLDLLADERADDERADMEALIPDERLRLMFVCAHPAIDAAARTPLMLQTVLGLDAARIASAFLTAPAAMSQRLVRAKTKIRDAGIAFRIPERDELPERLDAVLQAIYAAFGTGWDDIAGADASRRGLTGEAIWLGRVLVHLMPDDPEARGLLALMLHAQARKDARRVEGRFVPLNEQDPALWSRPMMIEAERELQKAAALQRPGRFQLEAAIQSVHAQRGVSGRTNWSAIATLYEGLVRMAPTLGVMVAQAAALGEAIGAEAGLNALAPIEDDMVLNYQPYWAVRAHLARAAGREAEAKAAFTRAIGLSEDEAVRRYLMEKAG